MSICSTILTFAIGWTPDTAAATYLQHRNEVPKDGIFLVDGWYFSSATHRYLGTSQNAEEVAIEVAKAMADTRFLAMALDIAKGMPSCLNNKLQALCKERVSTIVIMRLTVAGLTTISDEPSNGVASVVRALPQDAIAPHSLEWEQAFDILKTSASGLDDYALISEVTSCSGTPSEAAMDFNKSIDDQLGIPTTRRPIPVSDGWYLLDSPLAADRINKLATKDLVQLLARRPFDPQATKQIATKMLERGLPSAAETIRSWPTIEWIPDAEVDSQLNALSASMKGVEGKRRIGILRVLLHAGTTWPIETLHNAPDKATEEFDAGRVAQALELFIDDLGASPSASSANYVSACLRALNQPGTAAKMAMLALAWNPTHPEAAANLMLALAAAGKTAEASAIATKIVNDKLSNEWSQNKAASLLNPKPNP